MSVRLALVSCYRSALLLCSLILLVGGLLGCASPDDAADAASEAAADTLRIMTYNIEDMRTVDLRNPDHSRIQQAAAVIQHLRPDILLINEITYDFADGPWMEDEDTPGQNARRFAENFLAVAQADTLEGITYAAFMAPTNTGVASGFDLNRDGEAVTTYPDPQASPEDGRPVRQTDADRAYGEDAWGFGVFPGQYAMGLLVRPDLTIAEDAVRTFRLFRWSAMPDAKKPVDPDTNESWYSEEAWSEMRLSSKSHWDVPLVLPTGDTLRVLASHPTPPAFDGPEERNVRRNHDEIRFWADYLSDADYIYDDSTRSGGLHDDARFVLMGDQNADPAGGSSIEGAIEQLLSHPRVQGDVTPMASAGGQARYPDLDPTDTAEWGRRVDYVLPSVGLEVVAAGLYRPAPTADGISASDHFPVWIDVRVAP